MRSAMRYTFLLLLVGSLTKAQDTKIREKTSCADRPCRNGGECSASNRRGRDYYCRCVGGFSGIDCEWPCVDVYKSCDALWKDENRCPIFRQWTTWYDINCPVTCGECTVDDRTLPRGLPFPPILEPIEFIVGTWKAESNDEKHWPIRFGTPGKYFEEYQFEISQVPMFGTPVLNYTARAWRAARPQDVQLERGFITVQDRWTKHPVNVGLLRASNNGKMRLEPQLQRFEWIVGEWLSAHGGTVEWPTIPTMSFGESIEIWPSVRSDTSGRDFLNWTTIAWSHNTKDHFHNENAFITYDQSTGKIMFFGTGNNGFSTMEEGRLSASSLTLETLKVGRADIARELPTEYLRREFLLLSPDTMEMRLFMRTATNPPGDTADQLHAINLYKKVKGVDDF